MKDVELTIERESLEQQSFLRIADVSRSFGRTAAVAGVSLDVHRGEFFSLLGASGSGKTTLLRILAGFERPETGRVYIEGTDVTELPPYKRPVNMMFQSYALFPHMTVGENIAFGLRQQAMRAAERHARVTEMLELVRLTPLIDRKPDQLSGGERQRVALARSLARHPKLLLLDEPLAALDRNLRESTQLELVSLQARLGITFIMVTHDQDEAMAMSSRIAVMERGRILQVGTPHEVYETPASRQVAEFLGAANLFSGTVVGWRDGFLFLRGPGPDTTYTIQHPQSPTPGSMVSFAVRPEKIRLTRERGEVNFLSGTLMSIGYRGDVSILQIRLHNDEQVVRLQATNRERVMALPPIGGTVWIGWRAEDTVVLAP
jgi:putrescine transport system ATP-binding protein